MGDFLPPELNLFLSAFFFNFSYFKLLNWVRVPFRLVFSFSVILRVFLSLFFYFAASFSALVRKRGPLNTKYLPESLTLTSLILSPRNRS